MQTLFFMKLAFKFILFSSYNIDLGLLSLHLDIHVIYLSLHILQYIP